MPILKKDTRFFPVRDGAVEMITEPIVLDRGMSLREMADIAARFEGFVHILSPDVNSKRGDVILFDHSESPGNVTNIRVGDDNGNFVIKDWTGEAYGADFVSALSHYEPLRGKAFSVWRPPEAVIHEPNQPKPRLVEKPRARILPMNPYHSKRIPL